MLKVLKAIDRMKSACMFVGVKQQQQLKKDK
jgi:hypothetical protein